MVHILFNPKSDNSRGEKEAAEFSQNLKEKAKLVSVIGLDFKKFFSELNKEDEVILAGGDGTLNVFINSLDFKDIKNPLFYIKTGSGNDFYRDALIKEKDKKIDLIPFIKHLPYVLINGKKHRFLNGIGFGIDGDCCRVADEIKAKDPNAVLNYSNIAVKLLLKDFTPRKATCVVDGKEYKFENVWLSATMNGKFYGGGMAAAPKQDRLNNESGCTLVVFHNKGRLSTLLKFPNFSKGKAEGKKWYFTKVGKSIKVTFDIPCALQIDGDTVLNVVSYEVGFDNE